MQLRPVLLACALALPLAAPVSAQEGPGGPPAGPARISVQGEGVVYRAPDLAVTQLTVMRRAETAADATRQTNEAIAAVTAAMTELGVERRDLQTSSFQVSPQYQYDNRENGTQEPPRVVAYEVRNTLSVKVRDLPKLGELLDRAVQLGVNEGGSVSFQLEDDSEASMEARREAVSDARTRAETLAEAAGLKLGRVVTIEDGPVDRSPFPPVPFAEMRAMPAPASPGSSSVPVETGENAVNAQIRIVYELTP